MPALGTITVNFGSQTIDKGFLGSGWVFDEASNEVVLGDHIAWSTQPTSTPLEITYVPKDWAN